MAIFVTATGNSPRTVRSSRFIRPETSEPRNADAVCLRRPRFPTIHGLFQRPKVEGSAFGMNAALGLQIHAAQEVGEARVRAQRVESWVRFNGIYAVGIN